MSATVLDNRVSEEERRIRSNGHGTRSAPEDDYERFLTSKVFAAPNAGFEVDPSELGGYLLPLQRAIVPWALRRGRAAVFADTGLGKTLIYLEWARLIRRHTRKRVLILAPLAVARQTVDESTRFGIRNVGYARSMGTAAALDIVVTNYEMLEHFDLARFGGVVLDESSILKNFSGKVKKQLVASCRVVPLRLCCTATPAPNDTVELNNHADFLGVMSPEDVLSTFFISKGKDQKANTFRLKGHARKAFFRWLSTWAMAAKKPSDLGFSDAGYELPPLTITPHFVRSDYVPDGRLFETTMSGVTDRARVRRGTLSDRVEAAVGYVSAEPREPWLIWCGLNDEASATAKRIPGAVTVEGSQDPDEKADLLQSFATGEIQHLVTKCSIAGFGMNFQRCARMVFVGLSDSYEQYYQAIRRCWRFGQKRAVRAHIVLSELEAVVYNNVLRKEAEAEQWGRELVENVRDYERAELMCAHRGREDYEPAEPVRLPRWMGNGGIR